MANGKKISKKDAIVWVKKYKSKHSNSTNSIQYDASIIQELLNIPGCVSVRIHFAENNNGTNCMVLVAVDANGNAILPPSDTSTTDAAFILDDGVTCPPVCPSGDL
ncbi:MAG TPA: hypothetical protein VL728_07280 [Cyclobacteriaceae bacterium]|jgi:hypothetical protein|nr:hypothetical protein [Cyclobacteriaceae bacterium]